MKLAGRPVCTDAQMPGPVALVEGGIAFLTRTANADGGWAAYPGGTSDSESTALAALALGVARGRDAAAAGRR